MRNRFLTLLTALALPAALAGCQEPEVVDQGPGMGADTAAGAGGAYTP